MSILVIDDEAWLLENLVTILELEGYEVLAAADGLRGLQLAREHHPDLILCDIMMPELDGYGVLQELQSQLSTASIPFIFLSAKTDRLDRRQGMELGADDFLTKPVSDDELLAAIRSRLEKRHRLALQQYQAFAAQLVQLHEQQLDTFAQRLNQEMHQEMSNLQSALHLSRQLPPAALAPVIEQLAGSMDRLAQKLQRLSQEVQPYLLNEVGLAATLEWFLQGLPLQTALHLQNTAERYPPAIERSIYRIVQQAVRLAASTCTLHLWQDGRLLHLQMTLDPNSSLEAPDTDTSIMLMQEYMRHHAGMIDIQFGEPISIHLLFEGVMPRPEPADSQAQQNEAPPVLEALRYLLLLQDSLLSSLLEQHIQQQLPGHAVKRVEAGSFQPSQLAGINPHLVIMDQLAQAQEIAPRVPVLFLSAHDHSAYLQRIFHAGVQAVVLKTHLLDDLAAAVSAIVAGQRFASPASHFDLDLLIAPALPPAQALQIEAVLTNREMEVVALLLQDKSHAEIAAELAISPRTVEKHRANLMQKLGLKSHTELVLLAVRHGLLQP